MTEFDTDPSGDDSNTLSDNQLRHFLWDLKESGGSILVTGEVSERVARKQMQIAFGADDRKRVLGLSTAPERTPQDCLPDRVDVNDKGVRIVDRRDVLRSAAAPTLEQTDSQANHYLELFHFRHAIEAAIEDLDTQFEFQPGDLRVVINGLDGLLEATDRTTVRGFVRGLSRFVRDLNGISYHHLRHPGSSDIANYLSEAVDARLDLRYRDGGDFQPEHRWHILKRDRHTEWLRLDDK